MKLPTIRLRAGLAAAVALMAVGSAGAALAGYHQPPNCGHLPEIDPSLATGGIALIAGAVILLRERYRRGR